MAAVDLVITFQRKTPQIAPVNIQGLDIEMVAKYKYLGVRVRVYLKIR